MPRLQRYTQQGQGYTVHGQRVPAAKRVKPAMATPEHFSMAADFSASMTAPALIEDRTMAISIVLMSFLRACKWVLGSTANWALCLRSEK
jgi:hypothetical protein